MDKHSHADCLEYSACRLDVAFAVVFVFVVVSDCFDSGEISAPSLTLVHN